MAVSRCPPGHGGAPGVLAPEPRPGLQVPVRRAVREDLPARAHDVDHRLPGVPDGDGDVDHIDHMGRLLDVRPVRGAQVHSLGPRLEISHPLRYVLRRLHGPARQAREQLADLCARRQHHPRCDRTVHQARRYGGQPPLRPQAPRPARRRGRRRRRRRRGGAAVGQRRRGSARRGGRGGRRGGGRRRVSAKEGRPPRRAASSPRVCRRLVARTTLALRQLCLPIRPEGIGLRPVARTTPAQRQPGLRSGQRVPGSGWAATSK
mmetsp:Transcript_95143/g.246335  ORF Transcript_95143/g.246335 Transcript_95143/m.246335 type:complete len:262 (-) Transcript_95143:122-907(-)